MFSIQSFCSKSDVIHNRGGGQLAHQRSDDSFVPRRKVLQLEWNQGQYLKQTKYHKHLIVVLLLWFNQR